MTEARAVRRVIVEMTLLTDRDSNGVLDWLEQTVPVDIGIRFVDVEVLSNE